MPLGDQSLTATDFAVAGTTAGLAARFLTQPFDVIKIRFQLQTSPISLKSTTSKYQSVGHCIRSMVKEEGFSSLWKGHVPAQFLSIVYGGVQFWAFEISARTLYEMRPDLYPSFTIHLLCGGLAGVTGTLTCMPFDVIRTRLVAQNEPKTVVNLRHAFVYIYQNEKIPGFYRGTIPTLMQIAPMVGFNFAFNKLINSLWLSTDESQSGVQSFVSGGLSGLLAKTLVYPLDLTKKRLQIQHFQHARRNLGHIPIYNSLLDCWIKIYRQESVLGFFKGLAPGLIKAFISSGLHFFFYEETLKLIRSN